MQLINLKVHFHVSIKIDDIRFTELLRIFL